MRLQDLYKWNFRHNIVFFLKHAKSNESWLSRIYSILKIKTFPLACHIYLMHHITCFSITAPFLSVCSFLHLLLFHHDTQNIQLKYSPFYIKNIAERSLISICACRAEMQKFLHIEREKEPVPRCLKAWYFCVSPHSFGLGLRALHHKEGSFPLMRRHRQLQHQQQQITTLLKGPDA